MITLRPATERGQAQLDWLESKHTFSFGHYQDPQWTGFGPLCAINEDRVMPRQGFESHTLNHMEILSYVLAGEWACEDALGQSSVIRQGELRLVSAGTGVTQSEYNPSELHIAHVLQLWVQPDATHYAPRYQQQSICRADHSGPLVLLASKTGREGSLQLNQHLDISVIRLARTDTPYRYFLAQGQALWLHVAKGSVTVQGERLGAGDGAAVINEPELSFDKAEAAEVLLFSLQV